MVDLLAIGQGLQALKTTTDILKTMVGLRDSAKLLEKTVELNSQIATAQIALISAQQEQTTLIKAIGDLEKEIAGLKTWDAEKQKYELKDVGHGAFAYVRKEGAEPPEVPHWLCANCYSKSEKSILSRDEVRVGGRGDERRWICPRCKASIVLYWNTSPSNPSGEIKINA